MHRSNFRFKLYCLICYESGGVTDCAKSQVWAFQNLKPGQSHGQAMTLAWPGPRPEAGPCTSLYIKTVSTATYMSCIKVTYPHCFHITWSGEFSRDCHSISKILPREREKKHKPPCGGETGTSQTRVWSLKIWKHAAKF